MKTSRIWAGLFVAVLISIFAACGGGGSEKPKKPPAPSSLAAEAGHSLADLTWTVAPRATSYNVYYASAPGGIYTALAGSTTSTTFTVGSLVNNVTYYFVVTAVNSVGESGYSNEATATPGHNYWTPVSTGTNLPTARAGHAAVWTGTEMVIWGGYGGSWLNTGGKYDPVADTWTTTSQTNAPSGRVDFSVVWADTAMIVWGGDFNGAVYYNTGGRYNPSTNSWAATSTGANVPAGRSNHSAIWNGSEMIVWGGYYYNGSHHLCNDGGRYSPAGDSWIPTSTGANVPSPRIMHTAIRYGTEMIIWGGYDNLAVLVFNTGGRYNPATDSWTPTSTGANTPSARYEHTGLLTAARMIIWGGYDPNSDTFFNTGGMYDPAADSWLPISTGANVPTARDRHTAIWTGSNMIVWGGEDNSYHPLNTGGIYNPNQDTWTTVSTGNNVPSARYVHTAVWTGTQMIIWGGYGGASLDTGGRYIP